MRSSLAKDTLPPLPNKETVGGPKTVRDSVQPPTNDGGEVAPIEVAVTDTSATGATDVILPGVEVTDAENKSASAPEVLLRIHPAAPLIASGATIAGINGMETAWNRRQLPPVVGLPAPNGKLRKVNRKEMQKRFKEQLAEVWLVSV